jgi:hypothetical protein
MSKDTLNLTICSYAPLFVSAESTCGVKRYPSYLLLRHQKYVLDITRLSPLTDQSHVTSHFANQFEFARLSMDAFEKKKWQ